MTAKIQARAQHRFQASPERVYDAWLDPKSIRAWMGGALRTQGLAGDVREVQVDPRVGGAFLFTDVRDGVEARHWGTYLELDRPRKIVFTWIVEEGETDPSVVTLTLEPDGEGCVATIVHEMDAAWADWVGRVENGWSRMLQQVAAQLGG